MIPGDDTEGGFSLVEHPMPPRRLAAPLHLHHREDEYSFVQPESIPQLCARFGLAFGA